jgi:hypothetical protein
LVKPAITVALDGVVAQVGADHISGPLEGAHEFLYALDQHYAIHLFTYQEPDVVAAWLSLNDLTSYIRSVVTDSRHGVAFIQPSGIRFNGDREESLAFIEHAAPWLAEFHTIAKHGDLYVDENPCENCACDHEKLSYEEATEHREINITLDGAVIYDVMLLPPGHGGHPVTVRHPESQKFHDLLREIGQLHDDKQADYGSDADPFNNVERSRAIGVAPYLKCFSEMSDKMSRIESWCQKGSLRNESLQDTLRDMAVWSLIAILMLERDGLLDNEPEKA